MTWLKESSICFCDRDLNNTHLLARGSMGWKCGRKFPAPGIARLQSLCPPAVFSGWHSGSSFRLTRVVSVWLEDRGPCFPTSCEWGLPSAPPGHMRPLPHVPFTCKAWLANPPSG